VGPEEIKIELALSPNRDQVPPEGIGEYSNETKEIRVQAGRTITLPVGTLTEDEKRKAVSSLMNMKRKYGNSESPRVKAQTMNAVAFYIATEDIASGKLSGKNLAKAYSTLSLIYDSKADAAHALEDINKAVELDPENADYLISEAETLSGNGQFAEAQPFFEKGLNKTDSKRPSSLMEYGVDLHYLGQDEKASEVLDSALKDANGEGMMYSSIWRYIVSAQKDGKQALSSAMENSQDRSWPYPILEMLTGKINPDELLKASSSSDKGINEDRHCEAYFYIGQKYLIENDKEKAKEYFKKSVEEGVAPFVEYNYSLHELGMKKEPIKESSWWPF
jgi:lipoprotein NlpI